MVAAVGIMEFSNWWQLWDGVCNRDRMGWSLQFGVSSGRELAISGSSGMEFAICNLMSAVGWSLLAATLGWSLQLAAAV